MCAREDKGQGRGQSSGSNMRAAIFVKFCYALLHLLFFCCCSAAGSDRTNSKSEEQCVCECVCCVCVSVCHCVCMCVMHACECKRILLLQLRFFFASLRNICNFFSVLFFKCIFVCSLFFFLKCIFVCLLFFLSAFCVHRFLSCGSGKKRRSFL